MAVGTSKSHKRSKSKTKKSKDLKSSIKPQQENESKSQDNQNVDEDGIKKKLTNTAMFRKVKLRADDHLWWGLNSKYDDAWCGDLISFQLPKLAEDPMKVTSGAFKSRIEIKPYEIEGREETSAFAWGDGGEGRIGSGFGVTDRMIPTLVNKLVEPPPLVTHAFSSTTNNKTKHQLPNRTEAARVPSGSHSSSPSPIERHGAGRIIDVASGSKHCLCVTEDGVIYAWGEGHMGQLGSRKVK